MPIMDSLSKIAKSVGDGAKTAVKKSEDMVEVAKLNKSITNEEDRIKLTYNEIGKIIYSKYEKNEILEDELIDFCRKIDEFQKNIFALKEKIAEIKNVKICSNCGAEVELSAESCGKCGAKQEVIHTEKDGVEAKIEVENNLEAINNKEEVVLEEKVEAQAIIEVEPPQEIKINKAKFCSECGNKVVDDSKFCQECGARL